MTNPSSTPPRSTNIVLLIALGAIVLFCVCGVIAYTLLNATGIISTQVNLFRTATPTSVAIADTPTATSIETPLATFEPTNPPTLDTATPIATSVATSTIPETFVAFHADFFADTCPLFAGSNETREYGCDFGEYYMQHKVATTRYSYVEGEYDDAVLEANGYFIKGSGKYEYGVVFRANTDGTRYYVFTVTQDGKYNVSLYQNEKYTDLIPYTASPIVRVGDDNFFRVVMRGSKFDFYLNDEYLNSVTDINIPRGVTGFFFYNGEPNTEIGFDQLTISTFTPPPPTATPDSQIIVPTPTPSSVSAPTVAATVAVKPGVYVTKLRFTPAAPKRGQPVTFFATFLNSTGRAQNYKWLVEIFRQNEAKPYGQADALQREIPNGTNERATGDSWKVAGGGPCEPFRARVVFVDDQSRRIPFKRANGADLSVSFQVCP